MNAESLPHRSPSNALVPLSTETDFFERRPTIYPAWEKFIAGIADPKLEVTVD